MKKKYLIVLLFLALLSSCGLFNGKPPKQNAEADTCWELMFKLVDGKTEVPLDKLRLNGRIPVQQIWITMANLKVEKRVIVVRYTGISKATAIKVWDKLEKDKQLELLALTQILSKE